ncbi:MAG: ABC transporter ATP-binding protein [Deltaproteobacteria bacterium]|nr:ABC transporter ATP-binding protein [Deltaproteobacteria bacterium]MCW5803211.1 ABC transporter ATP-binding protein [Deltaproteobacteria bacterium]
MLMAGAAITATGLTKWFGEGDARTLAVAGVSFEANFGEMLFLVGPSGSGKTTLLSMISGVLRPNEGRVVVAGLDVWSLDDNQRADFRLHKVGFVFQDYHLFPRLTTTENVAIPLILRRHAWSEAMAQARGELDVVGLASRAEIAPGKLSGGEQQRVAIARALITRPEILIFDEPTASLDGDTGKRIMSFVVEHVLNEHRCILIVSHDERIFSFADRVMRMEDGHVVATERGAHA